VVGKAKKQSGKYSPIRELFLGRRLIVSCRFKIHDYDSGYAEKIC
jgi:hypothetical protein